MREYWKTVLTGLAAVLPLFLTFYIVYRILATLESLMGGFLREILGGLYVPGMGIVVGVALLYVVGMLVDRHGAVERFSKFGERQLEKVPVVKTIYNGLRDMTQFFSFARGGGAGSKQAVLVNLGDNVHIIGLTTGEASEQIGISTDGDESVAVYLPMSYQLGGFTIYLPRSSLTPIDMSVEQAMQVALTAGVVKAAKNEKQPS